MFEGFCFQKMEGFWALYYSRFPIPALDPDFRILLSQSFVLIHLTNFNTYGKLR